MKKLMLLLIFFFNIALNIKDGNINIQVCLSAAGQDYSNEGPGGDPDEGGVKPSGGTVWSFDPENERDPNYDPDWCYPDWAEWMDYLNFLEEMYNQEIDNPSVEGSNPGPSADPSNPVYWITSSSDGDNVKYYKGSQITVLAQPNGRIRLTVHWANDNTITGGQINWQKDGSASCQRISACFFSSAAPGTFQIKATGLSNRELNNVKLVVIDNSIIKFHRMDNYEGEYGFDEESYKHPTLAPPVSDYETLTIHNAPYNVPWMSLIDADGQREFDVKLEKLITQADLNNPNFKVSFIPTSPNIKINNLTQLTDITGTQLASMTSIRIRATEWDIDPLHYSQKSIEVKNSNTGEIIGKLSISCQKPQVRKVVFVYVNTGTGYRYDFTDYFKIDKDILLAKLNSNSHNQIFKKWEVVTNNPVTGLPFPTTLDLTAEYSANQSLIDGLPADQVPGKLAEYYKDKTGNNTVSINNTISNADRIYFHFITDLPKPSPNGGNTNGTVNDVGGIWGCLFRVSDYKTSEHELGHNLNLSHTFADYISPAANPFQPGIGKYTTTNIMDYFLAGQSENRKMLFYYQWLKSY